MADDILFHKYDLRKVVENQRAGLHAELDSMSDDRLLTTDLAELQTYAAEKYRLDLPMLGEPVVDEGRTKIEVGRWAVFPELESRRYK